MKSREPLLADMVIATRPERFITSVPAKTVSALQLRVRNAEKIAFDADASTRVAEIIRDIPELLVEEIQFARPPFELAWIEYRADQTWLTINPHGVPDEDMDTHVGLLADHGRIFIFSMTKKSNRVGVLPFAYHLNSEWPLNDQLEFACLLGTSRMGIDWFLWGPVLADRFTTAGQHDLLRSLRDHNMVIPLQTKKEHKAGLWSPFVQHAGGDFRNAVAFLLMLNQPSLTSYRETLPHGRTIIGNRLAPLMRHRTVIVSLDAKPRLIEISKSKGPVETRARHRVRGHYCHDKNAREFLRICHCLHDWQKCEDNWEIWQSVKHPNDTEPNHWRCRTCDGRRWWRADHARGDMNKGYVSHEYLITRS